MSCNIPIQEGVRSASDCTCYNAVMKAYGGMISAGQPSEIALDVATTVYGYHHPEDTPIAQALTVERWINEERLH